MISLKAVAQSLRKSIPDYSDALHDKILAGLAADGLAGDVPASADEIRAAADQRVQLRTLSAVAAQSSDHARLASWVHGACARLGFNLDPDKPIDSSVWFQMNAAFKGKDMDDRFAIKSALHQLGLIPA